MKLGDLDSPESHPIQLQWSVGERPGHERLIFSEALHVTRTEYGPPTATGRLQEYSSSVVDSVLPNPEKPHYPGLEMTCKPELRSLHADQCRTRNTYMYPFRNNDIFPSPCRECFASAARDVACVLLNYISLLHPARASHRLVFLPNFAPSQPVPQPSTPFRRPCHLPPR